MQSYKKNYSNKQKYLYNFNLYITKIVVTNWKRKRVLCKGILKADIQNREHTTPYLNVFRHAQNFYYAKNEENYEDFVLFMHKNFKETKNSFHFLIDNFSQIEQIYPHRSLAFMFFLTKECFQWVIIISP